MIMHRDDSCDDRTRLRDLLRTEEGRIKKFIRAKSSAYLLQRTTIDDLYQETVLEALESADRFVFLGEPRFRGWVRVIASRVIARVCDEDKKHGRELRFANRASTVSGVSESRIPSPDRTPSSVVSTNEKHRSLRLIIRALPPRYREVLTLYKVEERPLAEVAERLQLTKNATARLIGRALESLRLSFKA